LGVEKEFKGLCEDWWLERPKRMKGTGQRLRAHPGKKKVKDAGKVREARSMRNLVSKRVFFPGKKCKGGLLKGGGDT